MDLKFIEAFLKIVERGSFTIAADELFISQSTISKRIQQLEEELHTQLFERNKGKAIKITAKGEKIYPILKNAFDLIILVPKILQNTNEENTSISILCPVHMSDHIIPHLFKFLYQVFPSYNFSFNIGISQNIIETIKQGKVDVGFIYHETEPNGKDSQIHHITNEPTLLVASPNHPKRDTILSIEDLKDETMIIYHKALLTYKLLQKYFVQRGLMNVQLMEIQNFDLIRKMVLENNCIAFLQRVIVQQDLKDGTLIELNLKPSSPKTPIFLMSSDKVPPYVLSAILEAAKFLFQPEGF